MIEALEAPAAVLTLELSEPLESLELGVPAVGSAYRSALLLARRESEIVGLLRVRPGPGGMVSAELLEGALDRQLPGWRNRPTWHGVSGPEAVAPHVTVVVPTRSRPAALVGALASILDCDWPSFDVVVVDNARDGQTATALRRHFGEHPQLRCVQEPRPGVSAARNAGVSVAAGEIVAFVDDDVVVDRGWITALVDNLADTGAACATGLVLPLELDTPAQLTVEQIGGSAKSAEPRIFDPTDGGLRERLPWYADGRIGSGANVALHADVARALGGFDETLGAGTPTRGGEDLDLFLRLLRAGHHVSYDPRAVVWQRHPRLPAGLRRQAFSRGIAFGSVLVGWAGGPEQRLPRGWRHVLQRHAPGNGSRLAAIGQGLQLAGLLVAPAAYRESVAAQARLPAPRAQPKVVLEPPTRPAGDAPRPEPAPQRAVPVWIDVALIGLLAAAAAVTLVPAPVPVRLVVLLAAACLVPGGALVRYIGVDPGVAGIAMAASLGLAFETAASLALVWTGWWHPEVLAVGVAAASALLIVIDRSRRRLAPPRFS